ncbi:MAG TPA: DUF6572 domain-containing protein [Thermoanaerobaculia bacterium]|nr:DUF6572 domain-containing protein [Thermoanaerobaculia bacterium]
MSGGGRPGESEGYEPRGVQNPRIVDLVAPDRRRGEIVLSILEARPWSGGRPQLEEHEEKLNAYFVYVLDGHLARDYPQYRGMPARVELVCAEEPGEGERPFLAAVARTASENGLSFVVRVDPDPFARRRAPWEAGGGDGGDGAA